MRLTRLAVVALLVVSACASMAQSIEKQPASAYHARRVALAEKLKGGVAVLFAAEQPALDFMAYRQDEDF